MEAPETVKVGSCLTQLSLVCSRSTDNLFRRSIATSIYKMIIYQIHNNKVLYVCINTFFT